MVIRKQHIISWLLESSCLSDANKITVHNSDNPAHIGYLFNGIKWLSDIRESKPDWGVPELLMPSFEKVMQKTAKSFLNIDHQLFQEFYNENVCGILLHKILGTIIYGSGENTLYVWLFKDVNGSVFYTITFI